MTITQIVSRYRSLRPEGHFFDKDTLNFFGQTLKDFKVSETENPDIYLLEHTIWYDSETPFEKKTTFNWITGEMETV